MVSLFILSELYSIKKQLTVLVSCSVIFRLSYDEVDGGVALLVNAELVVLAGEYRVYDNADEGCDREAGEGYDADLDAADRVVDADCKNKDERCDDDVAAVGEVDLILNDVAYADC